MEVERVQALAHGNLHELPEKFIRPAHERPENTRAIEGVTVPVVSLSLPHDDLVDEVSKACSEWGFFLVTDHGISSALIQRLQEVGKEFFELPQGKKESCRDFIGQNQKFITFLHCISIPHPAICTPVNALLKKPKHGNRATV
ncbi:hypothetical protein RJ640_001275 [Escallonia rubra]|uniref:Non-haem dioxygenase N-terminal domain-containing protein n=1 Tax=Escallonia rubra TaxID=112253 RepID=A0AA88R1P6_9ASTE|nr:hypothetical protein RJ640_001275 [Escallonia rubra]